MTTETPLTATEPATGAPNIPTVTWETDGFSRHLTEPSASWVRTHR